MEGPTLKTMRHLLVALFVLGVTGTGAELLLLGHFENRLQLVPLGLMALSLLVLLLYAVSSMPASLHVFRYVMVLFVVSGFVGLGLHYKANVEFELEMYPSRGGFELIKETLTGAIPALAPGAMVQLGLLGWVYTFRHPAISVSGERKE